MIDFKKCSKCGSNEGVYLDLFGLTINAECISCGKKIVGNRFEFASEIANKWNGENNE